MSLSGRLLPGILFLACGVISGMFATSQFEAKFSPQTPRYEFKIRRNVQVVGGKTLIVNTVNGNVKGPAIHVRRGEKVSVLLTNDLPDHGVSLHWHGFEMRGVPHFDGVVGVTQCVSLIHI